MDTRRIKKESPRSGLFPPRKLSQLMTVVALSGLALAAVGPRMGRRPFAPARPLPVPPRLWTIPAPAPEQSPTLDDRFVVRPREHLDPRMVVAAPEGIDDRMIVPSTRWFAAPAPAPIWPAPSAPRLRR